MRLLIIGDIHGDNESFIKIISQNFKKEFDAILLVGDIGLTILNRQNKTNKRLKKFYELSTKLILQSANELDIPVLYVPGNWDLINLKTKYKNVHNIDVIGVGESYELNNFVFVGIGGSSFINGQFPYEWDEDKTYDMASKILSDVNNKFVILLSHDPPFYSTLDINYAHIHAGSETVRKIISEHNPIACISGHIHESIGLDIIGKNTLGINAGIIKDQQTYELNINKNNIDINIGFEERFFILDMSNIPIVIEQYYIRYNKIGFTKIIMKDNKLIVQSSTGSQNIEITGDSSYPSKLNYY